MFKTDIMPMPGNYAIAGQETGLWKVVYWEQEENPLEEISQLVWTQNLTWEEAKVAQTDCEKTLNG